VWGEVWGSGYRWGADLPLGSISAKKDHIGQYRPRN